MVTKRVSVFEMSKDDVQAFLTGDPQYVWIGMANNRLFNTSVKKSMWALDKHQQIADICKERKGISISEAIALSNSRYKAHVKQSPALLKALAALQGKTLVCVCSKRIACHGDVLIELLAEMEPNGEKISHT